MVDKVLGWIKGTLQKLKLVGPWSRTSGHFWWNNSIPWS